MNMSFALTTSQMYACTKFCTSRNGWERAFVGQEVTAVEKGQGIPKGGHVVKIGPIRFLVVRFELLSRMITEPEYGAWKVVAEGFPQMTPAEFVDMYCRANACKPERVITHIEIKHLYAPHRPGAEPESAQEGGLLT